MAETETQMDRIERKLDEVLAFRDLLLKFAMGGPMREKVARLMAGRGPKP